MIFEDEHLLVVNKPAGLNTHAPAPFAGEGLYDWLRHREPRWATLAIIHRLDKDTSGVLVLAKTPLANRSLTDQFAQRQVRKKYRLLTDRPVPPETLCVVSALVRSGPRYLSRPLHAGGDRAETRFQAGAPQAPGRWSVAAQPLTGRTHQIRVHAAERGFPILGDPLYGGTPAPRLCLHAAELALCHPQTGREMVFAAPADFDADPHSALRAALIDPAETDAFRLLHGAADGVAGWYVDRLGPCLLSQGNNESLEEMRRQFEGSSLGSLLQQREPYGPGRRDAGPTLRPIESPLTGVESVYHKTLTRHVRYSQVGDASPQHLLGAATPAPFVIREHGIAFELSFSEGYSVGLFLDQRDNRRRLLTGHIAAGFPLIRPLAGERPAAIQPEVLNTFAYTCGFSVCAARGGARTTSLDLSKKYLEWGRRNFARNGLDPAAHDFIYGDVFDWLRRLAKKGRAFDAVLLDPPTCAQSKQSGLFRVEQDFRRLVTAALPLLKPEGVLFASTNSREWRPEAFLAAVHAAVAQAGRPVAQEHYVPQPPDFPVTREEPAYLKTVWLRVG